MELRVIKSAYDSGKVVCLLALLEIKFTWGLIWHLGIRSLFIKSIFREFFTTIFVDTGMLRKLKHQFF